MRFLLAAALCIMLAMPAVHAAEYKWGQLNNTHINTLVLSEPDIAFREINLNVKSTVNGVWITFTRNDNRPYTVAENAGKNVYQYIETDLTNLYNPNIKNGTIKFAVSASWFADRSLDPDNVTLRWYDNYVWKSLPTRRIDGLYEADISGLDVFAITAQNATTTATTLPVTTTILVPTTQPAVTTTTVAEQKGQDILPIAAGILVLIAIVFAMLIARKKKA